MSTPKSSSKARRQATQPGADTKYVTSTTKTKKVADQTKPVSDAPQVTVETVQPWKHITVWAFGVIIASLLPFVWIYTSSRPGVDPPSIFRLLGNGDLFLVAIIVLIAGVTEIALLFRRIEQDLTVALLIIGGFLFVLVDAARYAGASQLSVNVAADIHSITYWSLAAFIVSALHSSICVGLAAGSR